MTLDAQASDVPRRHARGKTRRGYRDLGISRLILDLKSRTDAVRPC